MAKIALAEMIEELRKELQAAVKAGEGQEIRFGLGEVTLEAQVEVTREGGGTAGLKFWVAEVGTSGTVTSARTHKIVLKLEPRHRSGGKIDLARPANP